MTICWRDDANPPKEPDGDRNSDVVKSIMRTGHLPPEPVPTTEKKVESVAERKRASLRLLNNFEW
jgi:hypothetical protein